MTYRARKDPYTDQTTHTLKNLLGITDQEHLEKVEAQLTATAIAILTIDESYMPEDCTYELFLDIHRQLFGDIYEWAGQLRTIEIAKGNTRFAQSDFLEQNLRALFSQLHKNDHCMTTDIDTFVPMIAYYYSELIVIHPFREGNGRTIRTFLSILANSIGWHIAWEMMNPHENIAASIEAYNGNLARMEKMMHAITEPINIFWGEDPYEFISR